MSDIGDEHLAELTDLINDRLKEFELHNMQMLTVGHTRIAHDEIKRFYQEREVSWAMQRISDVTITAEMALKLSEQGYERGLADAKREHEASLPPPKPPIDPVAGDPLMDHYWAGDARGYDRGFTKGYQMARQELGIFETQPDAERLMMMSAPAHDPASDDNRHRDEAEDKRLGADDGHPLPSPAGQLGPTGLLEPLGSDDHALAGMGDVMDRLKAASNADPPTAEEFFGKAAEKRAEIIDALNSARAWEPDLSPEALMPLIPRRPRFVTEANIIQDAQAPSLSTPAAGQAEDGATKADLRDLRMSKDEKAAALRECLAALEDMSQGGIMPSQAIWDERKPDHLPSSKAMQNRYELKWSEIAAYAHLQLTKPGPVAKPPKPVPTPR